MAIISFKCPNCGGELIFDPATQKYKCEYCNSLFTQEELDAMKPMQGGEPDAVAQEQEGGEVSAEVLKEYADPCSDRYANMIEEIRRIQNFTSLRYHRLDDLLESIGIDPSQVCTYCFDGRE